jgi:hypothetical protein
VAHTTTGCGRGVCGPCVGSRGCSRSCSSDGTECPTTGAQCGAVNPGNFTFGGFVRPPPPPVLCPHRLRPSARICSTRFIGAIGRRCIGTIGMLYPGALFHRRQRGMPMYSYESRSEIRALYEADSDLSLAVCRPTRHGPTPPQGPTPEAIRTRARLLASSTGWAQGPA